MSENKWKPVIAESPCVGMLDGEGLVVHTGLPSAIEKNKNAQYHTLTKAYPMPLLL